MNRRRVHELIDALLDELFEGKEAAPPRARPRAQRVKRLRVPPQAEASDLEVAAARKIAGQRGILIP